MYSTEIEAFLKERNNILTPEECNMIIDVNTNTQIEHIQYSCTDNEYVISTSDGYFFSFTVKG